MLRPTLAAVGLAALTGLAPGGPGVADSRVPFALEVENATARVGEPTVVRATIIPPEGMKLTSVYRHRLIELSAFEDRGVEFDDEVVIGTVEPDGRLVFEIGVTPTEPGAHPINGHKSESKSVPLIATVTGTE